VYTVEVDYAYGIMLWMSFAGKKLFIDLEINKNPVECGREILSLRKVLKKQL
jgi:hypothetical protein